MEGSTSRTLQRRESLESMDSVKLSKNTTEDTPTQRRRPGRPSQTPKQEEPALPKRPRGRPRKYPEGYVRECAKPTGRPRGRPRKVSGGPGIQDGSNQDGTPGDTPTPAAERLAGKNGSSIPSRRGNQRRGRLIDKAPFSGVKVDDKSEIPELETIPHSQGWSQKRSWSHPSLDHYDNHDDDVKRTTPTLLKLPRRRGSATQTPRT